MQSNAPLTRRRKAAMIVQMMIADGGRLSLSELPENLQENLTQELGEIRLIDRETVDAVAAEFTAELESIGMTAPGTRDGAVLALSDHLSPSLASRLRAQTVVARNGDHWPLIADLTADQISPIMLQEAVHIAAIALSKLPVAKAAEVLGKIPGDRARRITFAVSQTADVAPDIVQQIGATLVADYAQIKPTAFTRAPVQRLGAILNSSGSETRDDVLAGLGDRDPTFASDVRKAIFTFADIPARIAAPDVPNITRGVDPEALTIALAYALSAEEPFKDAANFLLDNLSQRMAGQLREEASERGQIKKTPGEEAMTQITTTIRDMIEDGTLKLREEEED